MDWCSDRLSPVHSWKSLFGIYLGNGSFNSTYGAAVSPIIILVWVYYSAQILFFGSEFTKIYTRKYNSRIVTAQNAVTLTEEGPS
ncbi:MAG: YhjD/YihY/BrkB family envelope integrity protein [Nostoc sp.]|uniref:YhjD/YihY/BrkB family envelope integrity protein n=1 Tax=Nostoc sp. TaxID=1180 RepID=UPI002FFC695E